MNQKAYKALEYYKIINMLTDKASSSMGKEICRKLEPSTDIDEIRHMQTQTRDALTRLFQKGNISFGSVKDVRGSLKRLEIGSSLGIGELLAICSLLENTNRVKAYSRSERGDSLPDSLDGMFEALEPLTPLTTEIRRCILSEDEISDDASSNLRQIRRNMKITGDRIHTQLSSLVNGSARNYLQDSVITMRNGRYCIPVKAEYKGQVPGMVHDQSSTGSTLFIEPMAIVKLNNDIRELELEEQKEIEVILSTLSQQTAEQTDSIRVDLNIMVQLDVIFARASLAMDMNATEPIFNDEGRIRLKQARHPLIDKKKAVPIDIRLGDDFDLLVITGPNTGGKTVSLKTVGLLTLMGQSGLHIPTLDRSELALFEEVYADIGDEQSIEQSLSTFSSHMTNIIEILNRSDEDSFVLFDEICAGTDPVEGAVLAKAILEKLAQKQVTSVITTHYGELKALEYNNSFFKNASVEFNTETLKPTYKLLIGIPGLSNAISIAANLGLDKDIVEDAKTTLLTQKDPTVAVVEKLQETHQELAKNLEQAQELKESSLEIKKEYEDNLNQVKKDKKKTIKNIKNKFDMEMMEARAEIKQILDELRKEKSEKIARRAYSRLAKLEDGFRGEIDKVTDKQKYLEIDWGKVVVGDTLMLKNLHQKVTVLSLPDKNKRLFVDMGAMKMKVKKDELAVLDENYKEPVKVKIPGTSFNKFELKRYAMSQTLDLRGYRVEEALDEVEAYLDKASLANLTPVYIIHGHGTGALKEAVRDFLRTSPYVAKFRPGEDSEGGDGVSVVDIN